MSFVKLGEAEEEVQCKTILNHTLFHDGETSFLGQSLNRHLKKVNAVVSRMLSF